MCELAGLRALFCEYAMRGSKKAHPTLLVSSNTKWAYAVTVGKSTVCISEGPVVNFVYWVPILRIRNARQ